MPASPFLLDALLDGAREIGAECEMVRARGHKLLLQEDEEAPEGLKEPQARQGSQARRAAW